VASKRRTEITGDDEEVARKERVLSAAKVIGNAKDLVYGIRRTPEEQKKLDELRREALELGLLD